MKGGEIKGRIAVFTFVSSAKDLDTDLVAVIVSLLSYYVRRVLPFDQ
jgi:hypothetical protein